MSVKSDIEIAQAASVQPIQEIGAKLGIPAEALIPYGHDKAKISADFIKSNGKAKNGKLILVTAVSPTPAGLALSLLLLSPNLSRRLSGPPDS